MREMIKELNKSFMRLYFKIATGILAVIVINIFFSFTLTDNLFYDYFEKHAEEEVFSALSGLDFGISVLLEKDDFNSIQRMVENIGAYSFIDTIRVYDMDDTVLSSNNKAEIDKKLKNEIVDRVIGQNRLQSIDSNFEKKIFEVAVPIKGERYSSVIKNNIIGVIFVRANVESYERILLRNRNLFIKKYIASGVLLLLSILFLLINQFFMPVIKLFNAVVEVSEGDYKHEIIHNSYGEFSYLIKKFNSMIKRINVRDLELKQVKQKLEDQNEVLEKRVDERTKKLKLTQDVTIRSLASLAETRDNETGMHIYRTKNYMRILVEDLKEHPRFFNHLNDKTIELIVNSAPLHDIGKVGIPDSILMKPGKLTKEEFEEMKKHTVYGRDAILKTEKTMGTNSFLRFAKEIAYSHHEKWDGSGYPEGLVGEEIPVSARLMAIADVYDALISRRHYKDALSHEEAVRIITEGDGRTMPKHFDPAILEAFKKMHHKFNKIYLEFPENNKL